MTTAPPVLMTMAAVLTDLQWLETAEYLSFEDCQKLAAANPAFAWRFFGQRWFTANSFGRHANQIVEQRYHPRSALLFYFLRRDYGISGSASGCAPMAPNLRQLVAASAQRHIIRDRPLDHKDVIRDVLRHYLLLRVGRVQLDGVIGTWDGIVILREQGNIVARPVLDLLMRDTPTAEEEARFIIIAPNEPEIYAYSLYITGGILEGLRATVRRPTDSEHSDWLYLFDSVSGSEDGRVLELPPRSSARVRGLNNIFAPRTDAAAFGTALRSGGTAWVMPRADAIVTTGIGGVFGVDYEYIVFFRRKLGTVIVSAAYRFVPTDENDARLFRIRIDTPQFGPQPIIVAKRIDNAYESFKLAVVIVSVARVTVDVIGRSDSITNALVHMDSFRLEGSTLYRRNFNQTAFFEHGVQTYARNNRVLLQFRLNDNEDGSLLINCDTREITFRERELRPFVLRSDFT